MKAFNLAIPSASNNIDSLASPRLAASFGSNIQIKQCSLLSFFTRKSLINAPIGRYR